MGCSNAFRTARPQNRMAGRISLTRGHHGRQLIRLLLRLGACASRRRMGLVRQGRTGGARWRSARLARARVHRGNCPRRRCAWSTRLRLPARVSMS
jgi:hypothetical protein